MEKMTIHRALSELKTLDSRILKATSAIELSGFMQKDKKVNNFYDLTQFNKTAKSDLQSVNDLIIRKSKIKAAIMLANSNTMVTIAGKQMTITDAINFKSIIDLKKQLLDTLITKHRTVKATIEKHNQKVDNDALLLSEKVVTKDKSDDSTRKLMEDVARSYKNDNSYQLVDPLGVENIIKQMSEEIELFEAEVDAILSEVNATTYIEIE